MKHRNVFLSFLGNTAYDTLCYRPIDAERGGEPVRSPFVQEARLVELEARSVEMTEIVIFVTEDAERQNWGTPRLVRGPKDEAREELPGLYDCLTRRGFTPRPVRIPEGQTEEQLWTIFDEIRGQIEEGDRLYVDITYGFRSLPALALLALDYVVRARGAVVVELSYGALIRKDNKLVEDTSVFDLSPFLDLREWSGAVAGLRQGGDLRALATVTEKAGKDLKSIHRRACPEALRQLGIQLRILGEALTYCHAEGVVRSSELIAPTLAEAKNLCGAYPQTRPLSELLEDLERDVGGFVLPPDHSSSGGADGNSAQGEAAQYLHAQAAAARWCLEHGLLLQTATFIREAFVDLVAFAVRRSRWSETTLGRRDQDQLFGKLGYSEDGELVGEGRPEEELKRVWEAWWCRYEQEIGLTAAEFGALIRSVAHARNVVSHGFTVSSTVSHGQPWKPKPIRKAGLTKPFEKGIEVLERMVHAMRSQTPIQEGSSVESGRTMFVLLSHELTEEQRGDARSRHGVERFELPPVRISEGWSKVLPEGALSQDFLDDIELWLGDLGRPGDLLVVSGEYGMTFATVTVAQRLGLTPVYATTERVARDVATHGGQVVTQRVFRHVQFRPYPSM